jgi:hypothetical protein
MGEYNSMKDNELNKNAENDSIANDLYGKKSSQKAKESGILGSFKALSDLLAKLDKLPAQTKVRIIFKDYQNWVNFLPYYERYKNKFILFKDKKDFIMDNNLVIAKQENLPLKESLINWLEKNKVDEKIKQILLEELK